MNICIFAASSNRPEPVYFSCAERMGMLIASQGHRLVFGGGKDGLMGACARGAKGAGGNIIGVAPRLFDEPGFLLPECDELILTDSMSSRKEKMFDLADAFLALPGGIGTMDEFFEALTLKQLGLLQGPLVLLNLVHFYDPLVAFLQSMSDQGFMSESCLSLLRICSSPENALEALLRPEQLRGSIRRLEDYTG